MEFITELLKKPIFHNESISMTIVMDNARIHKGEAIKDLFEGQEYRHTLQYQPPWSPQLNAIEYCWSKIFNYIASAECNNNASLVETIKYALDSVTISDCAGWCRLVTRTYAKCIDRQPLRNE